MTPEEELARLNRLLHQYETVYRTTTHPEQRERVGRQIRELRGTREKILAVHVIDPELLEEKRVHEGDELSLFPLLGLLRAQNAALPPAEALSSFSPKNVPPTASQEEMFNLSLYLRRFEAEFLPFLTEKHLKLDFKFSMDRDSFYSGLQALQRSLNDFREECRRLAEGTTGRDMEREKRGRALKLARLIAVEGAKFFRALERFSSELAADATADGTKCLNGDGEVVFDAIEGHRFLQGRRVRDGLEDLDRLAAEAVSYLNVPDIESQESERADRH